MGHKVVNVNLAQLHNGSDIGMYATHIKICPFYHLLICTDFNL